MGKKIFLKTAIIILSSIKYNKFKNHLLYKKKMHHHPLPPPLASPL